MVSVVLLMIVHVPFGPVFQQYFMTDKPSIRQLSAECFKAPKINSEIRKPWGDSL